MSTRTKTILILVATLVVGILLGVLGSGAAANKRERDLVELRSERGLANRIESNLSSLTDEQRREVRKIVESHAPVMDSLRLRHRDEIFDHMASMRQELAAVLTPEQIRAIERRIGLRRSGERRMRRPDRRRAPDR